MTTVSRASAATNLNLSEIVDGQAINAADVIVPFEQAEAAIDEARATVCVRDSDTTLGNLDDKILVNTPLVKTINSPFGSETLGLSINLSLITIAASQVTSGIFASSRLPVMQGATSGASGVQGAVPAPFPGQQNSFLRGDGTWQAAGGTGTVQSVGLSAPVEFSVSGSPVTTSGTLAFAKANQNPNIIYAGPSAGGAAQPTFRALVRADVGDNVLNNAKIQDRGMTEITAYQALGASGSINITSIPALYDHLVVYVTLRSTRASTFDNLLMRFNNDSTTTNYVSVALRGSHSATWITSESLTSGSDGGLVLTRAMPAANSPANWFAALRIEVFGYASSNHKQIVITGFAPQDNLTGVLFYQLGGGAWLSSSLINRIELFGTFASIVNGSTFALYGIG